MRAHHRQPARRHPALQAGSGGQGRRRCAAQRSAAWEPSACMLTSLLFRRPRPQHSATPACHAKPSRPRRRCAVGAACHHHCCAPPGAALPAALLLPHCVQVRGCGITHPVFGCLCVGDERVSAGRGEVWGRRVHVLKRQVQAWAGEKPGSAGRQTDTDTTYSWSRTAHYCCTRLRPHPPVLQGIPDVRGGTRHYLQSVDVGATGAQVPAEHAGLGLRSPLGRWLGTRAVAGRASALRVGAALEAGTED